MCVCVCVYCVCVQKVTKAAAARKMLLMTAGARECIRMLPPLTITESEVDHALGVFEQSLAEVLGKK